MTEARADSTVVIEALSALNLLILVLLEMFVTTVDLFLLDLIFASAPFILVSTSEHLLARSLVRLLVWT